MSGCTGHCCRRFILPYGPKRLRRKARQLIDGEQIAAMVVYLGYQRPGKMFDSDKRGKRHYYTCKNLQPDGRCGIYATRPQMCAEYP